VIPGLKDTLLQQLASDVTTLDERLRRRLCSIISQIGRGVASEKQKLESDTETYAGLDWLTNIENFLLPIHWVLADKQEAKQLELSPHQTTCIKDAFLWCRGFCEAFYGGEATMLQWFMDRGIAEHLQQRGAAAHTAPTNNEVMTYLNEQYESRADPDEPSAKDKNAQRRAQDFMHSNIMHETQDGVGQVWVYAKHSPQQRECIALIAKVPTHGLPVQSARDADDKPQQISQEKRILNMRAGGERREPSPVSIRGVCPQLRHVLLTDKEHPIQYEEVIFTLPRVHFILRCAAINSSESCGLQLAGVHGAGKSTILRALVGILCVGGEVDSWFEAEASDIYNTEKLGSLLRSSTGSAMKYSHPLAERKATLSMMGWVGRVTSMGTRCWESTYTHFFKPDLVRHLAGCKLIIHDEVNKVIQQRQFDQLTFLMWDHCLPPSTLKILSASPDGLRERASGDYKVSFFELRPPPAYHMAAILSVVPHALDSSVQRPEVQLEYARVYPLCKMFAGNMRQIAFTLRAAFPSQKAGAGHDTVSDAARYDALDAAAAERYSEVVKLLSSRMVKPMHNEAHDCLQRDVVRPALGARQMSQPLKDLYTRLMNASLIVRRDATQLNSATDLVGRIACSAQVLAVKDEFNKNTAGTIFRASTKFS